MSTIIKELERAALDAHARGDDWATFWPTVAGDVRAALPDYLDRGRFVHRLVGLVAAGDVDGQRRRRRRLAGRHRRPGPWPVPDRFAIPRSARPLPLDARRQRDEVLPSTSVNSASPGRDLRAVAGPRSKNTGQALRVRQTRS